MSPVMVFSFFFFNDTATTEIYTLSLHDALPICPGSSRKAGAWSKRRKRTWRGGARSSARSEEHTSELQSRLHLVCRLLLEKKNLGSHAKSLTEAMAPTTPHAMTVAMSRHSIPQP